MPRCPSCDSRFAEGERFCPHDGVALRATEETTTAGGADPLIGRVLSERYRLDEKVGVGGMGAVYRARHLLMDRKVAIKVLREQVAAESDAARRFAREAKQTSRLDHDNCVRVLDFGQEQDLLYLVMEYLDGKTVGEEVHYDGPLASRRAAHIAAQAARALAHAHDFGIAHRDLKPDNIMLIRRGDDPDFVKVLDFGLAKLLERPTSSETQWSVGDLTEVGIVFGTPEYMSPEQASGSELDPRTDVYSLGVVLYQMLTGAIPFTGQSFMEILAQHVQEHPPRPAVRRPDLGIPVELDAIAMRCLEKRPADRFPSAGALAEALEAVVSQTASLPAARVDRNVAAAATIDLIADDALASMSVAPASSPARRRLRLLPIIAALLAIVAGAVAGIAVFSPAPEPGTHTTAQGTPAKVVPPAELPPAELPPGTREPERSDDGDTRGERAAVPKQPTSKRPAPNDSEPALREHLTAAARAGKGGNWLKQQVEADLALRIDSSHPRANLLMGQALLENGDARRACPFLRRARRLPHARTLSRDARCDSDRGD